MPERRAPIDAVTVRDTDEQLASIEAAQRNESHVIDALAGTGKTRQLIRIVQQLVRRAPDRRILILVFGRAAKEMIAGRIAQAGFEEKQVKVSTAHALAWPSFGKKNEHRVSADGEIATITALAESAALARYAPADPVAFATAVVDTLARYCSSAQRSIGIEHIPSNQANDADAEAILDAANIVWADFAEPSHALPIWHDVYLKLYALSDPTLKYTDLMFDEANDASPVMFGIYMGQKNRGVKIFVGDENQQIYAWRGAIDALTLLDLPRYPLTQSFRFGPNIADYANRILEKKGAKLRLRGVAEEPGRVVTSSGETPNVLLARTNLGMFEAAIDLVGKGNGISVVGSLRTHIKLLLAAYELYAGRVPDVPAISAFKTWTGLVTASKSEQGNRLAPYVRLIEKHQREIPKIAAKLADNAKAPSKGGVRLSTTHGLKGDSDEVVRLWPDFDSFIEKNGNVNVDEANLWYVAMTRPQRVLDLGGMASLAIQTLGEPKLITMKAEPRAVYAKARPDDDAPPAPTLPLGPLATPTRPAAVAVDDTGQRGAQPTGARVVDVEDHLSTQLAAMTAPAPAAPVAPTAGPAPNPAFGPSNATGPSAGSGRRVRPSLAGETPRSAPSAHPAPSVQGNVRTPRLATFPTSLTVEPADAFRVARLGARRSPIGWLVPRGEDLNRFEPWLQQSQAVANGEGLPPATVEPAAEPRHLVSAEPDVAHLLGVVGWTALARRAAVDAAGRCELCKTESRLEPHAHFELSGIMARMVRVEALCARCHRLVHIERFSDADLVRDLSSVNGESAPFSRARLARARKEQLQVDRRWYLLVLPEPTMERGRQEQRPTVREATLRTCLLRMVARIAFS